MNCVQSNILNLLRKTSSCSIWASSRCITTSGTPLYVQLTPALSSEPLKKKRRVDSNVNKFRDERRIRKIEKQIRKLEKNEGQLKPIEEAQVSIKLQQESQLRARERSPLSAEEISSRLHLERQWAQYRQRQRLLDVAAIDTALHAKERALEELRRVSEELWLAAITADEGAFPFRCSGPLQSLPIPNYDHPDGDYIDVSKQWD